MDGDSFRNVLIFAQKGAVLEHLGAISSRAWHFARKSTRTAAPVWPKNVLQDPLFDPLRRQLWMEIPSDTWLYLLRKVLFLEHLGAISHRLWRLLRYSTRTAVPKSRQSRLAYPRGVFIAVNDNYRTILFLERVALGLHNAFY